MRRSTHLLILVVAPLAALSARAQGQALDACRTPDQLLAGIVIPAEGASGVPTNVTPFVGASSALELLLVGDDGAEIPATVETIAVGNTFGAGATIKRIVPAGELNPGQNVTIVADGAAVTSFTVGGAADNDAPGAPDVALAASCEQQGSASFTVGVANDDAVLFVGVVDGQPVIGGGARIDGAASQNDELVLFGTGSADVNVAGVDLAGNVGASTPVKVDFPQVPGFSCASSGGGGGGAGVILLAAALSAARKARRRQ